MTPAEAARAGTAALADAWAAFTRSNFAPPSDAEPRDHCWASGFRACTRRVALDLQHPEIGRDFPDPAMEAMLRGRERESSVDARLRQLAARAVPRFEVVEGQARFQIRGRGADGADGRVIVTGKIDGRLAWLDGPLAGSRPVFECKSGRAVEHCETLADLDRGTWSRHYADQLLMYLFARGEPWGLLILDRPQGPAFVPIVLEDHLERVEVGLQQAETAVACRLDGAPLPPYHEDASECRRCPHLGKTCAPPLAGCEGLKALSDPSLIECAATVVAQAAAAKEYDRAKKRLAAAVRGNPHVLAGDYLVTGKWGRSSHYKFPAEVEARRAEEEMAHRVEDPRGKWYMEVEPLGTGESETRADIGTSLNGGR
jgi:hypothetical protein